MSNSKPLKQGYQTVAKRPPLHAPKRMSTSTSQQMLMSSAFSSSHLSNLGSSPAKRTLFQRLHAFQDNEDKSQKEMTERMSNKDIFQMMLKNALNVPVIEERKTPCPKIPRTNKSLILKKQHTQLKLAQLFVKKKGWQRNTMSSFHNFARRSVTETRNNGDLGMLNTTNLEMNDREPLNINLGKLDNNKKDTQPKDSAHSSEIRDLTARRATVKILARFDRLIHDKRLKMNKKPKFLFDGKKVAAQFCDTYINEQLGGSKAIDECVDDTNVTKQSSRHASSRRSMFSERVPTKRSLSFKAEDARQFQAFCQAVEDAYRKPDDDEPLSSRSETGPFNRTAKSVESARWWPADQFRQDEIRSPPMTTKKLRNLGFLSHSNLPKVDANLQPLIEEGTPGSPAASSPQKSKRSSYHPMPKVTLPLQASSKSHLPPIKSSKT